MAGFGENAAEGVGYEAATPELDAGLRGVVARAVEFDGGWVAVGGSRLEFWGGSFIADPFGRIIAQASHDKEEILYADLDPAEVETTRQHWPFLRDRRIDAYGGITKRFLD